MPAERSIQRIKDLLYAHGAVAIEVGEAPQQETIQIKFLRRIVVDKKELMQPMRVSVTFKGRKPAEAMRMLYYYLKAKWDAVDWGLISAEEAFLAYFMGTLPDGRQTTVGEMMLPDIARGRLPDMAPFKAPQLPGGDGRD